MDTTKEEEPDEDDEQLEDQIEEAEVDTSFEEELLDSGRGEDVGQENKEDTSMEEDDVMKEAEEEESNVNGRHEMLPQTDQGVEDNHVRGGAELAEEGEERVHDKMEVAAGNGQLHHFYNVDQTENEVRRLRFSLKRSLLKMEILVKYIFFLLDAEFLGLLFERIKPLNTTFSPFMNG